VGKPCSGPNGTSVLVPRIRLLTVAMVTNSRKT